MKPRLHDALLAGRWYPAARDELGRTVDVMLDHPGVRRDEPPSALIVPHAGYAYSGRAAGHAYAAARDFDFERVVILAPSHYSAFRGAVVLRWDGFRTPLGEIEIDGAGVDRLCRMELFQDDAAPFGPEHSIEIQLPFLQRALPQASVVPVLVGHLGARDASVLANGLGALSRSGTLFVVSSDFTHFGGHFDYLPFPAHDADSVRAGLRRLDLGAVEAVCSGDAARFRAYVEATRATICGRMPIEVLLTLDAHRSRAELLAYYTSLDVTGDYEHCVSYAGIGFWPSQS